MLDFINNAIFPIFRRFTADDHLPYRNIYENHYIPYASLSLPYLLTWQDIDHTLEISRLDDCIVLRYNNPYHDNQRNYLLVEPSVSEEHVRKIYELENYPNDTIIKEEPSTLVTQLKESDRLTIANDRDTFEYLYDVSQQATLDTPRDRHKRYQKLYFERTYPAITIRYIEYPTAEDEQLMYDLSHRWRITVHTPNTPEASEHHPERPSLNFSIQSLEAVTERSALMVFVDGEPVSFVIFSVHDNTAVASHMKVNYEFKYIFDYTFYRLVNELKTRNVTYINLEEDLGIAGLRHHKSLLHPLTMLEKVNITYRSK
jgi:hypothetical protein